MLPSVVLYRHVEIYIFVIMPQTDPFPVLCYAGNVECVHLNYFTSNLRELQKDCQPLLQALSLLPSSVKNEETLWCYICNIKLAITVAKHVGIIGL